MTNLLTIEPVAYTIAGSSEHSGKYVAENILEDNPEEQSSRWSGAGNAKQWMLLKTNELCVLSQLFLTRFDTSLLTCLREYNIWEGMS